MFDFPPGYFEQTKHLLPEPPGWRMVRLTVGWLCIGFAAAQVVMFLAVTGGSASFGLYCALAMSVMWVLLMGLLFLQVPWTLAARFAPKPRKGHLMRPWRHVRTAGGGAKR